jgi:hypothetical protein
MAKMFAHIQVDCTFALGLLVDANRRTATRATRSIAKTHREFDYVYGVMEVDALLPIAISLLQTPC